jgi:hypothetical protein
MYPSRNLLVGTAMVLTVPTVVAGAYLFSVSDSDSPTRYAADVAAAHGRYLAGGLLLAVGAWLFVAAAIGLLRLARPRGRALVTVGAVVTGCAAIVQGAGVLLSTIVLAALTPDHPSLAAGVVRVSDTTALPNLPFLAAPVMFLGLILAAAGLLMGGFRPVWLPVLLIAGAVVIYLFGDGEIGAVFHAPITLAIAGLGIVLARRSAVEEPSRTPAAVPETV